MKTIGIDCRFASTFTGLGRYTREITTHLLKRKDNVRYVLFVRNRNEEWLRELPLSEDQIIEADIPHYSVAEQLRFRSIVKQSKIDLLFSPHFNVPFFCPVPFVVTVHDVILHRYPNNAPLLKQVAYRILLSRAVRKARRVIAVSQFTASELHSLYGPRLAPVTVIHEGVSDTFQPAPAEECVRVQKKYALPSSFFLYMGNAKQHKNVPLLLKAFAALPGETEHLMLCTGGKEAESLVLPPRARMIADVPEKDLPALYTLAKAFVTASLYEGFCLPVAEAEACGCPVIATNRAAILEIASGSAVLLEPTVEDYTEALLHPPARVPSIRKLQWEKTAHETAELLMKAASREK